MNRGGESRSADRHNCRNLGMAYVSRQQVDHSGVGYWDSDIAEFATDLPWALTSVGHTRMARSA